MSRIVAAGAILACCAAFSGSAQAQPVTSLGGEPVNSLSVCSGDWHLPPLGGWSPGTPRISPARS
jgi:hypothetical protein